MSHHAKKRFPISTFTYLNTIWRTNGYFKNYSLIDRRAEEGSLLPGGKKPTNQRDQTTTAVFRQQNTKLLYLENASLDYAFTLKLTERDLAWDGALCKIKPTAFVF